MATARRGAARVVHLVGEPGIGKTALAEHAAALASGQGWVVVWGRAWGLMRRRHVGSGRF
jgi:MoxR-like ATPase